MYNRTKATSVEEYIELASDPQKTRIKIIRDLIHASVKNIEEKISYDMPAFIFKGKIQIGRVHRVSFRPSKNPDQNY